MNKIIASRIKEIRLTAGLTQEAFGKMLNVSQDTISLWEKGKSLPSVEDVIFISNMYGISSDYILGLSDY